MLFGPPVDLLVFSAFTLSCTDNGETLHSESLGLYFCYLVVVVMRVQVLGQSSQNRNSSGWLSQHQIMLCVLSPFFRGQMFLCNFRFVVFIMRVRTRKLIFIGHFGEK